MVWVREVKLVRDFVVITALLLILTGLSNAAGEGMSGKVLHVYSHDQSSSYIEIHQVDNRITKRANYTVEQTVLAKNYNGSAGVTLLDVKVKQADRTTNWYGFYLQEGTVYVGYSNDHSYIGSTFTTIDNIDVSEPHTYRIEVTKTAIKFYIDRKMVYDYTGQKVRKVIEVSSGGTYNDDDQSWDVWDLETTWDLYIDSVKEYWNGDLINEENFDDGSDDFYTSDAYQGYGDSGEEIISSESVPEFPFLEPLIDRIVEVLGL